MIKAEDIKIGTWYCYPTCYPADRPDAIGYVQVTHIEGGRIYHRFVGTESEWLISPEGFIKMVDNVTKEQTREAELIQKKFRLKRMKEQFE